MTIKNDGKVGIGTIPTQTFQVLSPTEVAGAFERSSADARVSVFGGVATANLGSDYTGQIGWTGTSNNYPFAIKTAGSERLRVDTSGRVLVNTSSYRILGTNAYVPQVLLEGLGGGASTIGAIRNSNNISGPSLTLGKSRSTSVGGSTVVQNGDGLGDLNFHGADGTALLLAAQISTQVDGTPGANDMPGRLVFSTTADGASSPAEQLRITSDRYVRLASGTGGIQFNGDTAAANALDDYEEGTFTPTITQGVTSPTYGGSNTGAYRIIGKQLFFSLRVQLTGGTADANQLVVGGLPFNALPGSVYLYPQIGRFQSGASNTSVVGTGQASQNSLSITDASDRTIVTGVEATNTLDLQITGSYPVG